MNKKTFSKIDNIIKRHLFDSNISKGIKFLALFACILIFRSTNQTHNLVTLVIVICLIIREIHHYVMYVKTENYYITNPKLFLADYFITIALTTTAMFLQRSGSLVTVYYFWLLDDFFILVKNRLNILSFPVFHTLGYFVVRIFEEWDHTFVAVFHIFVSFLFYLIIFLAFRLAYKYVSEMEHFRSLYTDLAHRIFDDRDVNIAFHRNEIAQRLHDSLGPLLLGALINIRYIKALTSNTKSSTADLQKEIDNIEETLQQSISQMRQCVNEIHTLTDSFNLTKSINDISERFDQLSVIHISFNHCPHIESINTQIKQVLYEIIRESVTNSISHGKASNMEISIDLTDDTIMLSISDDGIGCKHIEKSFGLIGIDNRVSQINGNVSYESDIDNGFITNITINRSNPTPLNSSTDIFN